MKNLNDIGELVGAITEITDDKSLNFIINNNAKCKINDIVAVEAKSEIFVLAKIIEINVNFYLENSRQYLVSKAVENDVHALSKPGIKPRYGLFSKALIIGYYEIALYSNLTEIKTAINRYTAEVLQEVYLLNFEKIKEVFGLNYTFNKYTKKSSILDNNVTLGTLSYPNYSIEKDDDEVVKLTPVNFNISIFKKHTLITGVTGAGKSRFAGLLIKELARLGAHISILDPHNEYADLLVNGEGYEISIFDESNINFSENHINAISLTKLIPGITEQQENLVYELFEKIGLEKFSFEKFINALIKDFNIELIFDYPTQKDKIGQMYLDAKNQFKNNFPEFVRLYIKNLKPITDAGRSNKSIVYMAILQKINELFEKGILSSKEPNWIKTSPNSVDIFNIDYNTNATIRRFIDAIIQYSIRKKSEDLLRIFVVDEAHLLLGENSSTSKLVKQFLREARKFNITIIFISQNISDISDDIRSQFQNQFIFREANLEMTKYFPDQICNATLYGAKSSFAMRVNDIKLLSEID